MLFSPFLAQGVERCKRLLAPGQERLTMQNAISYSDQRIHFMRFVQTGFPHAILQTPFDILVFAQKTLLDLPKILYMSNVRLYRNKLAKEQFQ
jgi:hypothetical protein